MKSPPLASRGGDGRVTGSTSGRQLRSLRGLSVALTCSLATVALLDTLGVVLHVQRAVSLADLGAAPYEGRLSEVNDATGAIETVLALHLLGIAALAALFIVWQWRHAKNGEALGAHGRLGPSWAIGGWFVPVANLVLPAVQLSQSSSPGSRTRRWIVPWAITFGVAAVIWTSSVLSFPEADADGHPILTTSQDVDTARASDLAAAAGYALYAIAAVLAVAMVRALSVRQAAASAASGLVAPVEPTSPRRSSYARAIDESLRTGVWRWSPGGRWWGIGGIAFCASIGWQVLVLWEPAYLIWWAGGIYLALLTFRSRVVFTSEGVDIRNPFRRRFLRWQDIQRVQPTDPSKKTQLRLHTSKGRGFPCILGFLDLISLTTGRRSRSDTLAGELVHQAAERTGRSVAALGGAPRRLTDEERRAVLKETGIRAAVMLVVTSILSGGS